jgi:MtN3 and saliva related transmembrane protein
MWKLNKISAMRDGYFFDLFLQVKELEKNVLEREFIEIFFSLGLAINALLYIPQIIALFKSKSTEGVSFITFLGFAIIQLFTILHALIHADMVLMLGTIFGFVASCIVTCQILYYRFFK